MYLCPGAQAPQLQKGWGKTNNGSLKVQKFSKLGMEQRMCVELVFGLERRQQGAQDLGLNREFSSSLHPTLRRGDVYK